ncbi:FKBP-type peptidyl-prolyl cis-trans isomerase [Nocardioides montaniterrae]
MSTRFRRTAVFLIAPALAVTLTACGSSSKAFDDVGISGDFGKAPSFTFKKDIGSSDAQTKTLIPGDGSALASGDHVLVNFAIADTTTKQTPMSSFDDSTGALALQVGQAAPTTPQSLSDVFLPEMLRYVKAGVKTGTRIAIAGEADKVFPDIWQMLPNLKYNIGNADGVVLVIDVVGVADAASGATQSAPAWAPKLVETGGKISALDFKGTPRPTGKLRVATLIKGTGPAVQRDQTASVKYLGQAYGAKKPFDGTSYLQDRYLDGWMDTSGKGADKALSMGGLVKGFVNGLVGVPVGSRVILEIPPALGYGKAGNSQATPKIKGTDTIYFVVDVLGAA